MLPEEPEESESQEQSAASPPSPAEMEASDAAPLELSETEVQADPLFGAVVSLHGVRGEVVAISRESTTGERLYLVRYADGVEEDLSVADMQAVLVEPEDHRAAAEVALAEAMAATHPDVAVELGDAVMDARQHQLDTPLLRQAEVRFAAVQQEAVAALTAARACCSFPAGPSRVGELTPPEREALAALQTATEWALDVHLEVDASIRELHRSEGFRG